MLLRRDVSCSFEIGCYQNFRFSFSSKRVFLLTRFSEGFPTDMTIPVTKAWEHTGGVMPRTLVPAQRMGAAEELAGTVLYLASKAGGYNNGNISLIDGGFSANHAGTY
jgi:hypothetical protein